MQTKSNLPRHKLDEERIVPWGDAGHFAWHVARYCFAARFVASKCVLDIGCGEGYGAAMLAETARAVTGIDYSPAAISHARASYGKANLAFAVDEATRIRSQRRRFEVVTCLEVVEHIDASEELVNEIHRLLEPGGILIMSTPNRLIESSVESVSGAEHYEYHVQSFSPRELKRALADKFGRVRLYGQCVRGNSLHTALKYLDVLNLRHRAFRSMKVQGAIRESLLGHMPAPNGWEFTFKQGLARQSPHVVAVAWNG